MIDAMRVIFYLKTLVIIRRTISSKESVVKALYLKGIDN